MSRSLQVSALGTVTAAITLALATPAGAQTRPDGISLNLALGIAGQNRDYRSFLGPAARLGVKGALVPRVHWGVDLGVERFGEGGVVYAPCPVEVPCFGGPGAATLVNATALLMLREEGPSSAYLLGGGGVTRLVAHSRSSGRRTYAHLAGGIGWDFRWDGTRPFLEFRFTRYLPGADPMSGWSMPVLVGFRF